MEKEERGCKKKEEESEMRKMEWKVTEEMEIT